LQGGAHGGEAGGAAISGAGVGRSAVGFVSTRTEAPTVSVLLSLVFLFPLFFSFGF